MILTATVGPEQAGMRLDDGAKALFPQLSKGEIRKIVDWGGCTIDQALVRVASRQLREGNEIIIGVMEAERRVELIYTVDDMLYEDADYVAINKAPGLNSQRTPYQLKATVEYAISMYFKTRGIQEPARVIHRLDRGTSGVMFFPKNKRSATHISFLLKEGQVEKIYWALVAGDPEEDSWQIDAPVAKVGKFRYGVALPGKPALTTFRVLQRGKGATLVEARPHTGRTHQIRVHLLHHGLPIIGDTTYGGEPASRMLLHCRQMSFQDRNGRTVSATAAIDEAFRERCSRHGIECD